ncbi:sigma-70 family RNA polymerase sigma factor [Engelhardtia mirabilis]
MSDAFEYDAFVCFAREDEAAVERLCAILSDEGRQILRFAADDAPTPEAIEKLSAELAGSRRVLGFLTQAWRQSWWSTGGDALLLGQAERGMRLIPLLIDGLPVEDVPVAFSERPGIRIEVRDDGSLPDEQTRAVCAVVCADHGTDQSTVLRLHRWFDGDDDALEQLLSDNLAWMQTYVRKHLNARLRRRFDSMDVVQEGAMRILRYNPRHPPANKAQMRALFKKALLDALRDKIDHLTANRRNIDREESIISPLASGDRPVGPSSEDRPDELADKQEQREWVKLALQFLDPVDRAIILRRDYHKEPFEEISESLGLASPDAARMRYNRALPKLACKIRELRRYQQEQLREPDHETSAGS